MHPCKEDQRIWRCLIIGVIVQKKTNRMPPSATKTKRTELTEVDEPIEEPLAKRAKPEKPQSEDEEEDVAEAGGDREEVAAIEQEEQDGDSANLRGNGSVLLPPHSHTFTVKSVEALRALGGHLSSNISPTSSTF